MKTLLAILACAALVAVANSTPAVTREKMIETAIETALEQVIEAETVVQSDEDTTSNEDTRIQNIFSDEQIAESQFFSNLWGGVKNFVRRGIRFGKKAYKWYNRAKNCPEMSQEMEDAVVESFLAQEKSALLQSMKASAQTEDEDDSENDLSSELQALLADQQSPAAMQGFWSKIKKFGKKLFKFGKKAYNVYNKIKSGQCAQLQDLPEGLEDAIVEAFVASDKDALKMAALYALVE